MMNRSERREPTALEAALRTRRDAGERGLIPFVTAGDPSLDETREVLAALDDAGVDAIEVGIPFSDPIADGPVIQAAGQRALSAGTTLDGVLSMLESTRATRRAPVVIFSYLNPILRMGEATFARRARESGASAVLLTDAVGGAAPTLEDALEREGMDRVVLIAPTTPDARVRELAADARGFIYLIARRGVTGQGGEDGDVASKVAVLREVTDVPVYVGFGVRTAADAARIGAWADGVIVGTALVEALHEAAPGSRAQVASSYARALRGGLDGHSPG